ncbi:MAG: amidohydrolase family protein [Pirellulales bacterium]|nr:amidohydrolase family protein [Pirellulales bacterium]
MSADLPAIDGHVHVWTGDLATYPLAAGYSSSRMQPPSFTPDEYLAIAAPLGVQRTVLIQMDFYGYDNSYLLDTIERFPGVFSGVAQIDHRGPDPATELCRLKTLGIRGARIVPPGHGDDLWLNDAGMRSLWRCAAEQRLAICPLIAPAELPAVSQMCERYSETTVVVDHFAGIGSDGTFRAGDIHALCDLAQFPHVFVKTSAFYDIGEQRPPYDDLKPMIRHLVDAYGARRLMWGSDSPFQLTLPNTYRASLEFVRNQLDFLSADDRAWLLERTATQVFFA